MHRMLLGLLLVCLSLPAASQIKEDPGSDSVLREVLKDSFNADMREARDELKKNRKVACAHLDRASCESNFDAAISLSETVAVIRSTAWISAIAGDKKSFSAAVQDLGRNEHALRIVLMDILQYK